MSVVDTSGHPYVRLRRFVFTRNDDLCSICMERMPVGVLTVCNHVFHAKCLRKAQAYAKKCPICRRRIAATLPADH